MRTDTHTHTNITTTTLSPCILSEMTETDDLGNHQTSMYTDLPMWRVRQKEKSAEKIL